MPICDISEFKRRWSRVWLPFSCVQLQFLTKTEETWTKASFASIEIIIFECNVLLFALERKSRTLVLKVDFCTKGPSLQLNRMFSNRAVSIKPNGKDYQCVDMVCEVVAMFFKWDRYPLLDDYMTFVWSNVIQAVTKVKKSGISERTFDELLIVCEDSKRLKESMKKNMNNIAKLYW